MQKGWRTTGSHTEWYIATHITGNRSRKGKEKHGRIM